MPKQYPELEVPLAGTSAVLYILLFNVKNYKHYFSPWVLDYPQNVSDSLQPTEGSSAVMEQ